MLDFLFEAGVHFFAFLLDVVFRIFVLLFAATLVVGSYFLFYPEPVRRAWSVFKHLRRKI